MRRRQDLAFQVERLIFHVRETGEVDTQGKRNRWIEELDNLFSLASSIAKGESNHQQSVDEKEGISPKQRQMWAHVAAHLAEVMGSLATGYEERQFNDDLAELERLVNEIKKLQEKRNVESDRPGKPAGTESNSEKVSDIE